MSAGKARGSRPRRAAPPPETPAVRASAGPRAALPWALAGALAIAPLLWTSRSPTLGMPVADDYLFLSRLASGQPLDLFGPMGAAYYWRPVSRQLYYLLVGPWLLRAPWVATLVAALLLLALYAVLYRLARRGFSPPLAAAIACFPLLSEPARVLLAWPSATQHLLGALFAALAIERAAAGRFFASLAAALLALLSNEAAAVVLPALPAMEWLRARGARRRQPARGLGRWIAGTLALAALWACGYALASAHGTGLPTASGGRPGAAGLAPVVLQALVSQLGHEGLGSPWRQALLALSGLLAVVALALSFSAPARARLARAAPALLGGLGWFLAAVPPLVLLLPDWNAWRTTVAALGLAFALTGWLGLVRPWLAAAFVTLRLLALLLALPAPATVTQKPPPTASSFSFARIVRLQRIVESARRALARPPAPPRGGVVRYSNLPRLAEVGFDAQTAPRLWLHDPTLQWRPFGHLSGLEERTDVLVDFETDAAWPAARITAETLRLYREAFMASAAGREETADSLLVRAIAAQGPGGQGFVGGLLQNRAAIAFNRRDYARAESLLEIGHRMAGDNPHYFGVAARLALARGDRAAAVSAVVRCLALDPRDPDGLSLARSLGIRPK